MTLPGYAACPWPADTTCCSEWASYDPAVQTRAIALASATLARLTAYRVTNCTVVVRPCKASVACTYSMPRFTSYYGDYSYYRPWINESGSWVNSCNCLRDCSCTVLCEVRLPAPVGRVDAVKVNGAVIPTTNYRLDGDRLIWTGATACPWPTCQNLNLPDTAADSFSVTYVNGPAPDGMGAYAAGVLACEFAKACSGGKCRLPSGVTAVVRQGVTLNLETGAFPSGFTGIREVDTYIALWNPKGRTQISSVWSPDLSPSRSY